MKEQKFNVKKFLKGVKNNLGKRTPEESETREEDLDSLNDEDLRENKNLKGKADKKRYEKFLKKEESVLY